jgi:RimJ/RimL family protein N-acetyltransferase
MNFIVKRPSDCTDAELTQFHALVASGGEVAIDGLRERIEEAHSLGFCFDGFRLVGVVGLKRPEAEYKRDLFDKAGTTIEPDEFLEIGWAYTEVAYRRQGVASTLFGMLLAEADTPVFATARIHNDTSRRILARCGFSGEGQPYAGRTSQIVLYVRRIDETLLCD